MQKIPAAQSKSKCLAVMDHVSQSSRTAVITKRGKPAVKLISAGTAKENIFGLASRAGLTKRPCRVPVVW